MNKFNYVPILKWRAAEITALMNVKDENKKKMMPVIELVMPTSISLYKKDPETKESIKKTEIEMRTEISDKFISKRIDAIPEEIKKVWGETPLFLDFSLLYSDDTNKLKLDAIKKVLPVCSSENLKITPVINLSDSVALVDEIFNQFTQKTVEDICIRITAPDLLDVNALNHKLDSFLKKRKLSSSQLHILVDLKYLDDKLIPSYKKLFKAAQSIYQLDQWKTFTFASGSFPADMSKYKVDEDVGSEPRTDWLFWSNEVEAADLVRKPIFGDYTIRNPINNEKLLLLQSSATLKYTTEKDWKIFRGQKGINEQYLAHANLLVTQTDYFSGRDFSFGDEYLGNKSDYLAAYIDLVQKDPKKKGKGTGRTGDWISAGVSHHLALVLSQLASQS
jgi:hypothetical protein